MMPAPATRKSAEGHDCSCTARSSAFRRVGDSCGAAGSMPRIRGTKKPFRTIPGRRNAELQIPPYESWPTRPSTGPASGQTRARFAVRGLPADSAWKCLAKGALESSEGLFEGDFALWDVHLCQAMSPTPPGPEGRARRVPQKRVGSISGWGRDCRWGR